MINSDSDTQIELCKLEHVPENDMRCVSTPRGNFLVVRSGSGVFVADEMCTHEDARLCDGNLKGSIVKCPLHGSRFELTTGQVLDDPATENLAVYPVTIVDGSVCISLADKS